MAERKAKWQNDYIARTYDRVNLTMPKGRKEVIQAKADAQGESVNAYINKAIEQRMEREAGEESPAFSRSGRCYRLSTESWKSSMASTKRPPTRTKTQLPV